MSRLHQFRGLVGRSGDRGVGCWALRRGHDCHLRRRLRGSCWREGSLREINDVGGGSSSADGDSSPRQHERWTRIGENRRPDRRVSDVDRLPRCAITATTRRRFEITRGVGKPGCGMELARVYRLRRKLFFCARPAPPIPVPPARRRGARRSSQRSTGIQQPR